ncbi:MAG: alpha/beta fold hydrolase [Myxococcaceae bacterium]
MSLQVAGGVFLALGLALALYLRAVRYAYRLRDQRPRRLWAKTLDGWEIAVFARTPPVRRFREPVLLCHGLATNHLNLDFEPPYSLARAFAEAGFCVYSLDWRGAGESRPPRGRGRFDFDADDLIFKDAPAVMDLLFKESGGEELFWVGHSLGGLVGYAVLGGADGARLRGLCALGAPVYFHYPRWLAGALRACTWLGWPVAFRQRLLSLACAPFMGRLTLPFSDVLLNPQAVAPSVLRRIHANLIDSMGYRLLRQLDDWTRHDRFCSRDGTTDYRARLADVRRPVLVLGGTRDRLAPPTAISAQAALLGSPDKTVMLFGRENGEALDYGHGDLLFGTGAPGEVYPRIVAWAAERATPLTAEEKMSGPGLAGDG